MGVWKEPRYDEFTEDAGCVTYIILTHYDTYYVGITNNLLRRWKEHKKGYSSYLGRYSAKEVLHVEFFKTRTEARRKEVYIKRVGARKFLLRLKHKAPNYLR